MVLSGAGRGGALGAEGLVRWVGGGCIGRGGSMLCVLGACVSQLA